MLHPSNSDQFTKREAAQENIYVKEKELEKYDLHFIFHFYFIS